MQAEEGATQSVELRCFPPTDPAFRRFAERTARALGDHGLASPDGPRLLENALRTQYPQAVVRPRSELGALDLRPAPTWYVYRDGKVVAEDGDAPA